MLACVGRPSSALDVVGISVDTSLRVKSPASCAVIRSWQGDMDDMDGTPRGEPHRGLDIVAPIGTPVIAGAPGKVIYRDTQWAGGNSLLIWHGQDSFGNRVISYYVHMSEFKVEKGETVRRGQVIGLVGNTGHNMPKSRTPHLHFEVLLYPDDTPHFLFGWLRGFTTVSPNYFLYPMPVGEKGKNAEVVHPGFSAWHSTIDYGDGSGLFTGFTFPVLCRQKDNS